jgi:hypothetical protein
VKHAWLNSIEGRLKVRMTPEERSILEAVRKIGEPALQQWKYRYDTPMGDFARAVVKWRKSLPVEEKSRLVPKGRLVPG